MPGTVHNDVSTVSRIPPHEERISVWIQRVMLVASVAAAAVMISLTGVYGDAERIVASSVYGASLIALYFTSSWYHATIYPRRKQILKALDHASIYILIAGTYTPFTLVTLQGAWGWSLFGVTWGLAALGILWKVGFSHRFQLVSTLIYLAMGWVGVVAAGPLMDVLPTGGLVWLVLGGVAFTVGTLFFLWEKLPYHHVVWHGFVLAGVGCHYGTILGYVLLYPGV